MLGITARIRLRLSSGLICKYGEIKDLLEKIPNKITDTMEIIVDVNLMYKDELEYLQIVVDKYPSLISFRGKYYYRSGSTMREITGKELERKLLKRRQEHGMVCHYLSCQ